MWMRVSSNDLMPGRWRSSTPMGCNSSLTSMEVEVFLVPVVGVKAGTISILQALFSPNTGHARRAFPDSCP